MTALDQQVAVRLHELAALAGPAAGATTADRAVALARDRRRRPVRWGAAVLVLCLWTTVVGLTRDEPTLQGRQTPAGLAASRAPESYDSPPRGSLAGDDELLAELAALDWAGPYGPLGDSQDPVPGTRRVVYAADVPGGGRWAVVIGRADVQWLYAWFAGPSGADPDELQLVTADRIGSGQALALMDVSDATGPLVVLSARGDSAEYSPSLDRTEGGDLFREFDPLPLVDGVPTAVVTTPVTWDAGEVHLLQEGSSADVQLVTTGQPDYAPVYGPDEPDPAVVIPCMAALGIDVHVDGQGNMSWGYGSAVPLSSAEQAAQERAADQCWIEATGG